MWKCPDCGHINQEHPNPDKCWRCGYEENKRGHEQGNK